MHSKHVVANCQAALTILVDEMMKKTCEPATHDKARYDAAHAILLSAFKDASLYHHLCKTER